MISFISKKAALENLLWPLTELTWQQEPWFPSKGLSLSAEFMVQRGWTFTHHDLLPRQGRGWKKGQRLSPQVCPSSTRQKFLLYPRFKIKKKKKVKENEFLMIQRFFSLNHQPSASRSKEYEESAEPPWGRRSVVNQDTLMYPIHHSPPPSGPFPCLSLFFSKSFSSSKPRPTYP